MYERSISCSKGRSLGIKRRYYGYTPVNTLDHSFKVSCRHGAKDKVTLAQGVNGRHTFRQVIHVQLHLDSIGLKVSQGHEDAAIEIHAGFAGAGTKGKDKGELHLVAAANG